MRLPSGERGQKPQRVQPIVDAHLGVLDDVVVLAHRRDQRKRQEAVRNRCAVRTFGCRAIDIYMDPLAIFGHVGERVDLLLVDAPPRTYRKLLPDRMGGVIDGPDHLHENLPRGSGRRPNRLFRYLYNGIH
jgi:hypothetical protein